ncbi:MAG TPA: M50 family metallopeptidase [Acidimicrobiales bacterium]
MPEIDWESLTTRVDPPATLVLLTGALALALVAIDSVWRWSRNVVTIVHEAGHAVAALLTGRRLTGIRLHSDTSGLTLSVGKPRGAGMVLTMLAGYVAPSLVGLAGVLLLAFDQVTIMLWGAAGLLLGMLTLIKNVYGALLLVATGAVVVAVSLYADADTQAAFGYAAAWFLLLGAVRPVGELQRQRRQGGGGVVTDADQLAQLTRIPGTVWVGFFGVTTLGALVAGGWLLIV